MFVIGVLAQNEAGATYEEVVYDRQLMIRMPDGRKFSIFDFADPISTALRIDEVYTMLLVPFVVSLNLVLTSSPSAELETTTASHSWQGIVLDPDWEAPKDAFRLARPELYGQRWVLVATSYGDLLLNPGNIRITLSAGTVVQWENTRLDLYAVV